MPAAARSGSNLPREARRLWCWWSVIGTPSPRSDPTSTRSTWARWSPSSPADVAAFARQPGPGFDVVVADPPYEVGPDDLRAVLADLHRSGRLRGGADIVIERANRSGDMDWPSPLRGVRSRRYGDTVVHRGTVD